MTGILPEWKMLLRRGAVSVCHIRALWGRRNLELGTLRGKMALVERGEGADWGGGGFKAFRGMSTAQHSTFTEWSD